MQQKQHIMHGQVQCTVHLHSPDLNGFFTRPQKQEQSLSAVTPQYSTTLKAVIQKHYSSAVTDRFVYVCANSLFCIKRKSALEHRLRQNEQSNYFRALGLQYVMKDHQSQLLNMQNTKLPNMIFNEMSVHKKRKNSYYRYYVPRIYIVSVT